MFVYFSPFFYIVIYLYLYFCTLVYVLLRIIHFLLFSLFSQVYFRYICFNNTLYIFWNNKVVFESKSEIYCYTNIASNGCSFSINTLFKDQTIEAIPRPLIEGVLWVLTTGRFPGSFYFFLFSFHLAHFLLYIIYFSLFTLEHSCDIQ